MGVSEAFNCAAGSRPTSNTVCWACCVSCDLHHTQRPHERHLLLNHLHPVSYTQLYNALRRIIT